MITNEELGAIRKRCEAADPEPWRHYEKGIDGFIYSEPKKGTGSYCPEISGLVVGGEAHEGYIGKDEPNAIFIRHSRTDIPALLAEVERLRQLVICDCCGEEGSAVCSVCDNDDISIRLDYGRCPVARAGPSPADRHRRVRLPRRWTWIQYVW